MRPDIKLVTGHPSEEQTRDQLLRLFETYDLDRWRYADVVQIQHRVIPHSHPVLTLNTQWIDNDNAALASYLHEQLHWFLVRFEAEHLFEAEAAEKEMRERFPSVPKEADGGARDESSTYLHLFVCALEADSLAELIGWEAATATLKGFPFYRWVYATVLTDWPFFSDFLLRYGLRQH